MITEKRELIKRGSTFGGKRYTKSKSIKEVTTGDTKDFANILAVVSKPSLSLSLSSKERERERFLKSYLSDNFSYLEIIKRLF